MRTFTIGFLVLAWVVSCCCGTWAQTVIPNGVQSVDPSSAVQGTGLWVTFTLSSSTNPPVPPSGISPTDARIGAISGTSISRDNYTVRAFFLIPSSEAAGPKDAEIEFPGPSGTLTAQKTNGFEVLPSGGTATPTPTPSGPTPTPDNSVIPDLDYPVIDTGQDTCFNDLGSVISEPSQGQEFHGQDAQYDGIQPHYTVSGDGLTIYDNNTGLTWQKSPDTDRDGDIDADDKLLLSEAKTYASSLNAETYGGYSDWRVPGIKEIYSLMDFRGTDPSTPDSVSPTPFIDTNYFEFGFGDEAAGERLIDAQYASTTEYESTTMDGNETVFGLNLADGRIKGYPINKTFYLICCRGNSLYGQNDFVNNGDGTVTDHATGLMWQQGDSGIGMNWEQALAYAESLALADHDDWRLPNAKELQSLVDYTRCPDTTGTAAINAMFSCTGIVNEGGVSDFAFYWTGTTHIKASNYLGDAAAYVSFGRALGYWNGRWQDVHGAGAQRSDPKYDDGTEYPYGHGPQGDAIRIDNFIRCVRDAEMVEATATATATATEVSSPTPVESRVGNWLMNK